MLTMEDCVCHETSSRNCAYHQHLRDEDPLNQSQFQYDLKPDHIQDHIEPEVVEYAIKSNIMHNDRTTTYYTRIQRTTKGESDGEKT